MKRNYSQLFAICKKNRLEYKDVVSEFTKGRTESLKALTDPEYNELMRRMARYNTPPPGDQQRKKMIAICKLMHKGKQTAEILQIIDEWLLKQKYEKPLMQLDLQQLGIMVNIYETNVYPDYLRGLNK
ncbi:hypothetical protein [Mucilaginibacter glaciei]|uniref:Uncharacterized protein n=1 Tax=Mucilaginibacter glaciei TaxID=2772109 RepID=A0A926NT76_9SPHI|nr:hypothetical protein [Mucilaginibacter glaciei]MBD1394280.1 hypothetical protein [Mucilaginibacter glaciei]